MVDPKSPELPGSIGVRKSTGLQQGQKISSSGPTDDSGPRDHELVYKTPELTEPPCRAQGSGQLSARPDRVLCL